MRFSHHSKFELKNSAPQGSKFVSFIQCARCHAVVGVVESVNLIAELSLESSARVDDFESNQIRVLSEGASGTTAGMKGDAKRIRHDVKNTTNELKHRTVAEGEHLKRDALGDEMTTVEKVKSGANELKNRAEANIDKTKRNLRHRS